MTALLRSGQTLTPLEVKLMHFFSQNPNRVVPRLELIDQVWRKKAQMTERVVDVAVSKLRRKLDRKKIRLITVYGRGYRWLPTRDIVKNPKLVESESVF
jgi:DNA-binding response OmpR family regulator